MSRAFAGAALSRIRGERRDITLPAPAAGADWVYTLANGSGFRVLALVWTLTASAQVAKRYPSFRIQDGDGNTRLLVPDTGEVAAASVATVSAAQNITTATSSSGLIFGLQVPNLIMDQGWRIGSFTTNLQTEDQISGVRMLLEQLLEDNPGEGAGVPHQPTLEIDLEVDRAHP
jgi:hypothetical protein